jgi:N-acetylneuraminate synthase/N,N'-diacetyllegionaminate synthase
VHFTESRDGKDFRDHQVSFEPKEFSELLRWTVSYERLLGNPDKKPMPSEIKSGHIESFRRSVYLKRDLEAGTTINSNDLIVLRPNTGIDARLADTIVGKTLNRDVAAFKRLEMDYFDS